MISRVYIYIYICIDDEYDYEYEQIVFPTLSCPTTKKVLHIMSEIFHKNKTQNDAVEKELSQLIIKIDINDRFHRDGEVTCLLNMGKFYENKYVIKLIIHHPKFDPLLCSIMLGRNILNVILYSDHDETCEAEFKIIAITAILKKLVLVRDMNIISPLRYEDDKEYIEFFLNDVERYTDRIRPVEYALIHRQDKQVIDFLLDHGAYLPISDRLDVNLYMLDLGYYGTYTKKEKAAFKEKIEELYKKN